MMEREEVEDAEEGPASVVEDVVSFLLDMVEKEDISESMEMKKEEEDEDKVVLIISNKDVLLNKDDDDEGGDKDKVSHPQEEEEEEEGEESLSILQTLATPSPATPTTQNYEELSSTTVNNTSSPPPSPRISINVTGINMNLLKRSKASALKAKAVAMMMTKAAAAATSVSDSPEPKTFTNKKMKIHNPLLGCKRKMRTSPPNSNKQAKKTSSSAPVNKSKEEDTSSKTAEEEEDQQPKTLSLLNSNIEDELDALFEANTSQEEQVPEVIQTEEEVGKPPIKFQLEFVQPSSSSSLDEPQAEPEVILIDIDIDALDGMTLRSNNRETTTPTSMGEIIMPLPPEPEVIDLDDDDPVPAAPGPDVVFLSPNVSLEIHRPLSTNQSATTTTITPRKSLSLRSLLKRRVSSSSSSSSCLEISPIVSSVNKPTVTRKSIRFDGVTVFYFPRSQGFTCIPSQGGSTLGMSWKHVFSKKFSLIEYAIQQRKAHKRILARLNNKKGNGSSSNDNQADSDAQSGDECNGGAGSSDEEQNGGGGGEGEGSTSTAVVLYSNEHMEEEDELLLQAEHELNGYYFLQPVPIRQRRALLRQAGVKRIDSYEKDECKEIRSSREFCGCSCKSYCDPITCSCAQADIKCQVDRLNFPCGCSRDACSNPSGRVEFNPVRVRTHFIHTLMRLELEKKHQMVQMAAGITSSDTVDSFPPPVSISISPMLPPVPSNNHFNNDSSSLSITATSASATSSCVFSTPDLTYGNHLSHLHHQQIHLHQHQLHNGLSDHHRWNIENGSSSSNNGILNYSQPQYDMTLPPIEDVSSSSYNSTSYENGYLHHHDPLHSSSSSSSNNNTHSLVSRPSYHHHQDPSSVNPFSLYSSFVEDPMSRGLGSERDEHHLFPFTNGHHRQTEPSISITHLSQVEPPKTTGMIHPALQLHDYASTTLQHPDVTITHKPPEASTTPYYAQQHNDFASSIFTPLGFHSEPLVGESNNNNNNGCHSNSQYFHPHHEIGLSPYNNNGFSNSNTSSSAGGLGTYSQSNMYPNNNRYNNGDNSLNHLRPSDELSQYHLHNHLHLPPTTTELSSISNAFDPTTNNDGSLLLSTPIIPVTSSSTTTVPGDNGSDSNNSTSSNSAEDFGEIIKKSMVETVSA